MEEKVGIFRTLSHWYSEILKFLWLSLSICAQMHDKNTKVLYLTFQYDLYEMKTHCFIV